VESLIEKYETYFHDLQISSFGTLTVGFDFQQFPDRLWGPPSLLYNEYCGLFRQSLSGRYMKLTTDHHLVLRPRMRDLCFHSPIRLYGVVFNNLSVVITLQFLCFSLRYGFLYKEHNIQICMSYNGPPLWSSGQRSWLQIQRSWVRFQIFWEVVGLERGPVSLLSTIEELLGRNSNGSGLENREYGRGDPLRWPRDTLYEQKLALTAPTSGGRSVGIVRLRTKTMEFVFVCISYNVRIKIKTKYIKKMFLQSRSFHILRNMRTRFKKPQFRLGYQMPKSHHSYHSWKLLREY
jgi:hypothetical protein